MGAFVEGVWYLRPQCIFSKPIICILSFFFIFSFKTAQGEIEGHFPGVVTKWWQCHPQMPNGNEKVGS
jgi:hypothetical protein